MSSALPKSDQRHGNFLNSIDGVIHIELRYPDAVDLGDWAVAIRDLLAKAGADQIRVRIGRTVAEQAAREVAEEQALYARERRERIATAVLAGIMGTSGPMAVGITDSRGLVNRAILAAVMVADGLIAELDKPAGERP